MLNQEQLREVLARAEEIQRESGSSISEREVDQLINAASEVGLSREAVLQALRERVDLVEPPKAGERVFAASTDGHFYPARVVSVSDTSARVRFQRGTEHNLRLNELRPFAFIPGQRVVCLWPWWGWWTCDVVSYDEAGDELKVTDGWTERTFAAAEVRLPKEKSRTRPEWKARVTVWVLSAAAAGGAIGSLLTWLLTR